MARIWIRGLYLAAMLLLLKTLSVPAATPTPDTGPVDMDAYLKGFREVPSRSTSGHGTFTATLSADQTTLHYTLTFNKLGSNSTTAHIHFGQRRINGGILAFLCGGGGKPASPPSGGTINGTIQSIAAGNMAAAIRAIFHGVTYVNIHSVDFPDGEIRGQIGADQIED